MAYATLFQRSLRSMISQCKITKNNAESTSKYFLCMSNVTLTFKQICIPHDIFDKRGWGILSEAYKTLYNLSKIVMFHVIFSCNA